MLRLSITIRGDSLMLEGDMALAEVVPVVRDWYAARTGDDVPLLAMTTRLSQSTDQLAAAIAADPVTTSDRSPLDTHFAHFQGETAMPPSTILADLDASVTKATTVQASAATLIRGIAGRLDAAVAKALDNGATAEQLAPVTAEVAALNASSDDLTAAVTENTPAA